MSKLLSFFEHLHRIINLNLYRHIPDIRPNFLFFFSCSRPAVNVFQWFRLKMVLQS